MEGQKDNNGFELQDTMPPQSVDTRERKQSIPTEPPKVPGSRNSMQGPPKPSKSSSLPVNGGKSVGSVENGHSAKSKAEEAEESGIAINLGYFQSWQASLKVIKVICFIAMIICMSVPLSGLAQIPKIARYDSIWKRMPTLECALAVSVIALIVEIAIFVIYFLGLNRIVNKYFSPYPFVLTAAHSVLLILVFVSPIILNVQEWHGSAITSFLIFNLFAFAGYTMDVYFNAMWLTGGPELARLPCF